MLHLFWILIAFALVFLNAFFVAAEFGMVKLRTTRVNKIKKTYGFRGRILANVHKHLDAYLSACQLGITLASLGLGWIGEPAFAHLLEPILKIVGASAETIRVTSFFIAFSFISFLHIVIGELMPKSLAIRQSENISIWTAVPLYLFYWLMYPAIWLLNTCSNFLLRIAGLETTHHGEHFYSTDEIQLILTASHLYGELTKEETEILESTLKFADLTVTDVMRPDEEMISVDIEDSIEKILKEVMETRYSRYPIYDDKIEKIIGIVHVKDLFSALYQQNEIISLQPFIRPVLKVSHQLLAIDLLKKFREGVPHFALVYGDYGNLIGFVTLDNLLHILVGRIKDEFHRTREDWEIDRDGSIIIHGNCSIYTLERALNKELTLPDKTDIETLAGFITAATGAVPKAGEKVEFNDFTVLVEEMSGARIVRARIFPKPVV
jgi:CBS domain containing-hemolysin-like protein